MMVGEPQIGWQMRITVALQLSGEGGVGGGGVGEGEEGGGLGGVGGAGGCAGVRQAVDALHAVRRRLWRGRCMKADRSLH